MIIEREPIVIATAYLRTYGAHALVHRAFSEHDFVAYKGYFIPCIGWWLPDDRCYLASTTPTCVRCIAARRP